MVLILLCDENVPYPIVKGLLRRGFDVLTVQEIGLHAAQDDIIMARALREGRIIYTLDADFLRLHQAGQEHAGIFYHHQRKYSIKEAIRRITLACELFSTEDMKNRIEFL